MNNSRSTPARSRLFLSAVVPFLFALGPVRAEPAQLTIGQGWAWVREIFPSSGTGEIDSIVWTNPPSQIDLSTLQVWNIRRPWPLLCWRWQIPSSPAIPPENAPVVWRPPHSPPAASSEGQPLEIRLAEPMSHRMGHSLTYRLPGWDWSAFYRITVRGIGPHSIDSVQVDLAGFLRIQNNTDTAYSNAVLSLIGVDVAQLPPAKPFGLLDLNPDSALSDLWLSLREPAALLSARYPLRTPATLPARNEAEFQFARVVRKPAQITHVCHSDNIPSPSPRGGLPLNRILLISNSEAMGLGFPLPPGKADLFLGSQRGAPIQTGYMAHTPFPGILRLDMGKVDSVLAIRQSGESLPLPEGAQEVEYSVTLLNHLDSPVHIEVEEKPGIPMQWNLIRSSIPCTETTRALHFDLTLPPHAEQTITYRLRQLSPP